MKIPLFKGDLGGYISNINLISFKLNKKEEIEKQKF